MTDLRNWMLFVVVAVNASSKNFKIDTSNWREFKGGTHCSNPPGRLQASFQRLVFGSDSFWQKKIVLPDAYRLLHSRLLYTYVTPCLYYVEIHSHWMLGCCD
jgi:hypothetical protein